MKQIVVASVVLSLIGIGRLFAADFPPPSQPPVPPPIYSGEAPSKGWSGVYLGINGGYGFGSSQWSLGGNPTSVFDSNGFLVGGTVGMNFPVSEVLFGVEGDIDWAGLDGNVAGCAVTTAGAVAACETRNNFLTTARARVGYAFDRTLVYVTGGGAFGNVQTGLNPPASFDSTTKAGWAAGAGIEYAFSDNWSAKAEYLYVNLGSASCTTLANCGSASGASVALTEDIVRAGLNYKFSW